MKKIKLFLLSLLVMLTLVGCGTSPKADNITQSELNSLIETLEITDFSEPLTGDVLLKSHLKRDSFKYEISYTTSSELLKIDNGATPVLRVTRPNLANEEALVTAEISANGNKAAKDFIVTILAANAKPQPKPEPKPDLNEDIKAILAKIEINNGNYTLKNNVKLANYVSYASTNYPISYSTNSSNVSLEKGLDATTLKITREKLADIDVVVVASITYNSKEYTKSFNLTILKAENNPLIDEFGLYDDKDHVALYIVTYEKLPSNYLSRSEFNSKKNQWNTTNKYTCFGGRHGNNEGHLPKNDSYYECDVDYGPQGPKHGRGTKRLVYSLKTLNVYYTGNHYKSFTQLYDHGSKC